MEDEGFASGDIIIDMIADTEQRPGIEVIREAESEMTELGTDVWAPGDVDDEFDTSC